MDALAHHEQKIRILYFFIIHDFVKIVNVGEIRESLARIFCKLGIRDVDAIILAELIIEDREMAVDELKRHLNYSISGITSSLHRLMRLHLVVRSKRGKRYMYHSQSNILSILLHLIEEINSRDIPNLKRKIDRTLRNLGEEGEKIKKLRSKVEKAEMYLQSLITLLSDYEEVRA